MKQFFIFFSLFGLIFISPTFAADPLADRDALLSFLENTYEVIGRYPEGGGLYDGTITLKRKGDALIMTRLIRGKKTVGTAGIATATADAVPVLQATFCEGGRNFQATYIICSDPDNYARLSGRICQAGKVSPKPGMEALFVLIKPDT